LDETKKQTKPWANNLTDNANELRRMMRQSSAQIDQAQLVLWMQQNRDEQRDLLRNIHCGMRLIVLALVVVVLSVAANFALTLHAIALSKESHVRNETLVTSDGGSTVSCRSAVHAVDSKAIVFDNVTDRAAVFKRQATSSNGFNRSQATLLSSSDQAALLSNDSPDLVSYVAASEVRKAINHISTGDSNAVIMLSGNTATIAQHVHGDTIFRANGQFGVRDVQFSDPDFSGMFFTAACPDGVDDDTLCAVTLRMDPDSPAASQFRSAGRGALLADSLTNDCPSGGNDGKLLEAGAISCMRHCFPFHSPSSSRVVSARLWVMYA
jgi:hypothetical protein